MAKYTVKCAKCGKDITINLYGPWDGREKALQREYICDDCKAAEHRAENERAAAENAEAGLPTLMGSAKQIAWAETIRASKVAELRAAGIKPEKLDKVLAVVTAETSAAWWIDNRANDARAIMASKRDAIIAACRA